MQGFEISCNASYNPPKPFLNFGATQQEVVNISVAHNQVRIRNTVVSPKGFDQNGSAILSVAGINLTDTPFILSSTANKFIVTGCNSLGFLSRREGEISTGCYSLCGSRGVIDDGSCSGNGCCETPIYEDVKVFGIAIQNLLNDSTVMDLYNVSHVPEPYICGYSFVVDRESYTFEASDIDRCSSPKIENSSLVLDWVVGNDETCEEAGKNRDTYACKGMNIKCMGYESDGAESYRCGCIQGYEGNPYLASGCQDINECLASQNPCQGRGNCINLPGGYKCMVSKFPTLQLVLGIGSFLFLLLLAHSLYICIKRRKLMNLKQKFFQKNGGLLLQQQIAFHEEPTKIFTTQELAKATDNYAESRVVGRGGNGTVYKGILCDEKRSVIAVKKSRTVDENHIEEFVNEVVVLTRINHRNVVKLLGCCLETEVPLLVYEYVPNGSLIYHIHDPDRPHPISWENRLTIAVETANALAYLHSATTIPVIHRDVKLANILLDEEYSAKVSDFGTSRLIPADRTEITTLIKGTLGYLVPEYFQTSQLTDKSDVYSFGVVLLELLTGQLPVSFARPEAHRNLSSYFILAMHQDQLFQILEPGLANEGNREQIKATADLALRCLRLKGGKRPAMKQVALELAGSRGIHKHPLDQVNHEEEATCLLDQQVALCMTESSSSTKYSIHNSATLSMDFSRSSF